MDASVFKTYKLTDSELDDVKHFTAACTNNNYHKRGQRDGMAKAWQRFMGKAGEIIAYRRLSPSFAELTQPDFEVYEAGSKNWSSDLVSGDLRFAVKTCGMRGPTRDNPSWLFNKADDEGNGRDKEIYEDEVDKLCVFVRLDRVPDDYSAVSGRIRAVIPLSEIKRLSLFDLPEKENLQDYKDAVYQFDLAYHGFVDKIHPSVNEMIEKVQA